MRRRRLLVTGAGGAALSILVALSGPASAGRAGVALVSRAPTAAAATVLPGSDTCVSQLDDDNGSGLPSQNFEHARDAYDSKGADDFTLTRPCTVREVDVAGRYFNGDGVARSVRVIFYANKPGRPGAVLRVENRLSDVDSGHSGNLRIPLRSPVSLAAGTYWVTVQVNMSLRSAGQWGWNTNNTQRGAPAVWKNGGDGFRTGCTRFEPLLTCVPGPEGPDFAFALVTSRVRGNRTDGLAASPRMGDESGPPRPR